MREWHSRRHHQRTGEMVVDEVLKVPILRGTLANDLGRDILTVKVKGLPLDEGERSNQWRRESRRWNAAKDALAELNRHRERWSEKWSFVSIWKPLNYEACEWQWDDPVLAHNGLYQGIYYGGKHSSAPDGVFVPDILGRLTPVGKERRKAMDAQRRVVRGQEDALKSIGYHDPIIYLSTRYVY